MQTVILAAGEGSRMLPLTDAVSKPLLPVGDRPLIDYIARDAVDAGASRLIIVVGKNAGDVRDYFGTDFRGVPVTFAVQTERAGTAHALLSARPELDAGPVAVLNGDIMVDGNGIETLYQTVPAVGAARVENPSAYGVLELGAEDCVAGIIEKPASPPSNLVNAGAYTFPDGSLGRLDEIERSERGEYELTDLLDEICLEHDVTAVDFSRWLDVGRPWELLAAMEWRLAELERSIEGAVDPAANLVGSVVVEPGAEIREGVTIEGPALVEAGATIGPNAYVRGTSSIGPNAHVGHAVEVKNSLLFEGATVGHQSYVGDSLLGADVNLGAGTNVANLRHDGESIVTTVKGERVTTDRRKYGAVFGPNVKTGINTSVNAGVVLPSGTKTRPGEVLLRDPD